MGLPIDFEEKVKQPPAVGGVGGYPYSISAKHLMQNFVYASPVIPLTGENGLNGITEVTKTGPGGHQSRELSTTPLDPGTTAGDVLYWDGTAWVPLAAPSGTGKVLSHTGSVPEWIDAAGGDGGDLNLTINYWVEDGDGYMGPGAANDVLYFRNGLFIGTTDPGGTEPPGLIEKSIANISLVV